MKDETHAADQGQLAATAAETRALLLKRAKRDWTPLANAFVQIPRSRATAGQPRSGPLAQFVNNRDLRGLHALLLAHAITSSDSAGDGWSTTLYQRVWARALGITDEASTDQAVSAAMTRTFARLAKRNLIQRSRRGRERKVRITLLHPDGSGDPYERPTAGFLKLSNAFWLEGWHAKLDLPATAMLLVSLHARPEFKLPTEHVPEWYGWSADTAERGFKKLGAEGLLAVRKEIITAPLARDGIAKVNVYRLQGPFERQPTTVRAEV